MIFPVISQVIFLYFLFLLLFVGLILLHITYCKINIFCDTIVSIITVFYFLKVLLCFCTNAQLVHALWFLSNLFSSLLLQLMFFISYFMLCFFHSFAVTFNVVSLIPWKLFLQCWHISAITHNLFCPFLNAVSASCGKE